MSKIRLYTNDHDISMLEITNEPRNVFISAKKAAAILETNDKPKNIEIVEKYGRELFKISYPTGKSFTIGVNKINAVLDNAKAVTKALL